MSICRDRALLILNVYSKIMINCVSIIGSALKVYAYGPCCARMACHLGCAVHARPVLRAAQHIIGNLLSHRRGIGRHKALLIFMIYVDVV